MEYIGGFLPTDPITIDPNFRDPGHPSTKYNQQLSGGFHVVLLRHTESQKSVTIELAGQIFDHKNPQKSPRIRWFLPP